ncbi:GNAT family N-acetyltransferase [Pelagibius marinus]|uniref:GNAT family N-acetyltransferase n=1 Tax=Pelagibius marinus TaxID=2762760 RepID=UPI00187334F0|nr:GNAT family N-acetyltransferase [Pelagibius marinus]
MSTQPRIPLLTTERLILRGQRADDFQDYAALRGDPEVARYIGGKTCTPAESWSRLQSSLGHWALMGYGFWAVEERASGRFVGEVGFADFKRGLGPDFDGAPEAGWVLAPWAHGKGYATEAAEAALAWGERELGMTRFVCMIDRVHAGSLRVAEKCGFRKFAETEFTGDPVILLERVT